MLVLSRMVETMVVMLNKVVVVVVMLTMVVAMLIKGVEAVVAVEMLIREMLGEMLVAERVVLNTMVMLLF